MKRYPFSIRSSCFTTNSSFCSTNLWDRIHSKRWQQFKDWNEFNKVLFITVFNRWSNTMKMLKWIEAKKTKNVWAEMFPHSLCIILWSLLLMQQKSTLIPQWLNSRIELRKVHFECNKNTKYFYFVYNITFIQCYCSSKEKEETIFVWTSFSLLTSFFKVDESNIVLHLIFLKNCSFLLPSM